jgi:hypothetical protein
MRTNGLILAAVMAGALAMAGCSKEGGIDTTKLETGFKAAEASLKDSADKAAAAVKSADYSGAAAELKRLAQNAKLTPEQQQSLKDTLAQVEKAIADAAAKAADEAKKAMKDVPTSLPKQ